MNQLSWVLHISVCWSFCICFFKIILMPRFLCSPLIRPVFVLWSKDKIETNCYKFKTKCGSFVTLQSQWFSFVNPWTKEVEYIGN